LEENGHVEDDGVDGDCADEVGEDEVAARGAGEDVERHDGAGGTGFDVDEEGGADDEDGEGGEDEGVRPGVDVASETLVGVREIRKENKGYSLMRELETWCLL
jgi:hypothetical protein